jgi:hypothetical protein
MKRKGLRVIRKGAVLEGELPKALTRQGPKWLKTWPKRLFKKLTFVGLPLHLPHGKEGNRRAEILSRR